MQITRYLAIAIGGAAGTLGRVGLIGALGSDIRFPLGIFVANLVGSAFIGVVVVLTTSEAVRSPVLVRALLATGFCGGLTTLSSLSVALAKQVESLGAGAALSYGSVTIATGVVLCFGATVATRSVLRVGERRA
ncbi:MAG: fluoride efflux transporter FluC [Ferrimicrobium sp.]